MSPARSPSRPASLAPGDRAPAFVLLSGEGKRVRLSEFRGKRVVLYFYPKDGTSGCTTEACEFRDAWRALRAAGAVVLGVSPDGQAAHEAFRIRHRLPFPLLTDPDHRVAEAYGAWGEKRLYGRTYQGILRSTVLIGRTGRITHIFRRVKPRGHAAQVLAALEEAG